MNEILNENYQVTNDQFNQIDDKNLIKSNANYLTTNKTEEK